MSSLSPIARRVRNLRRTATRMSVSIGVAVLVAATVMPLPTALASERPPPPPDRTALVLCGTTCPTPDPASIEAVRNRFIGPTHPGENIKYIAVTAPMEGGPITGVLRLILLVGADPKLAGFDGPAWPDEPLWKLSGIFDLNLDQSTQAGVPILEAAMAANGNGPLVIYGISQGATIANIEKQRLAEQYPEGTDAPDIDFVLQGDPNLPNGGLWARFPGLYIPIIGWK